MRVATDRQALSARAVSREYGISRETLVAAMAAGELRAARLGSRRYTILRRDLEAWLYGHAVRPSSRAEDVVTRRLEREAT